MPGVITTDRDKPKLALSGGVDDGGGHAVASSRSSRTAWAASRLSNSDSGPASSSSRKPWNASDEQSSPGLVTTTAEPGGKSTERQGMYLQYRRSPLH